MNYKKNSEKVKQFYTRNISEGGIYVGKISKARFEKMQSGAKFIHFSFTSPEGNTSFSICVADKKGNEAFGVNLVYSLIEILNLEELNPIDGTYEAWDYETKQIVLKNGLIYPTLEDKAVAVVLQKEYYLTQNGNESYKLSLKHFLSVELRTADEITRGVEAKLYHSFNFPDLWTQIGQKPIKYEDYLKEAKEQNSSYQGFNDPKTYDNSVEDDDDTIPF